MSRGDRRTRPAGPSDSEVGRRQFGLGQLGVTPHLEFARRELIVSVHLLEVVYLGHLAKSQGLCQKRQVVAPGHGAPHAVGTAGQGVVSVPRTALTEEQGLYYVYIKEGKDVYRKQEVTPGASDGSRTAILHGLHGGEQVVVAGVYQVKLAALSGVVPEGHSHEH